MKHSSLFRRRGTEGPRHDPYYYEEIVLEKQDGSSVLIHEGLDEYTVVRFRRGRKGKTHRLRLNAPDQMRSADKIFCKAIGLTYRQIRRAARKLEEVPYRMHKVHGGFRWEEGFPGETLCFCKCGSVIDSHFNRSAIE